MNYIHKNTSTSTSAPIDSGLVFSIWADVPEEMASCLAKTRCKSSFNASPWHKSDSSLKETKQEQLIKTKLNVCRKHKWPNLHSVS